MPIQKTDKMIRFSEDTTQENIDRFVSSLPEVFFTHKDVMRCYSIYQRREFHRNAHSFQPAQSPAIESPTSKSRKKVRRWTDHEIEALKHGVAKHGKHWLEILKEFPTVFGPNARSANDLEKKWQRLAAKGDTKPSQTLFKESLAIPPV